jgi:hypothetical protein
MRPVGLVQRALTRPELAADFGVEPLGLGKHLDQLRGIKPATLVTDRSTILSEELRANFNARVRGA